MWTFQATGQEHIEEKWHNLISQSCFCGHKSVLWALSLINGDLFLQINVNKFIYIEYSIQNPVSDIP